MFGSSKSDSSGGLEDIMKELQKKMGGASSGSSSKGNSVEDIVRDLQQKMGGGTTDGGGLSDVAREIRRKMGMDTSSSGAGSSTSSSGAGSSTSSGSTASDVAKELRKRMGIEEKETSTTQKKTKKAEPAGGGMGNMKAICLLGLAKDPVKPDEVKVELVTRPDEPKEPYIRNMECQD